MTSPCRGTYSSAQFLLQLCLSAPLPPTHTRPAPPHALPCSLSLLLRLCSLSVCPCVTYMFFRGSSFRGKPVFMCEGHDLWRSWWQAKEPNVVRAAWAVTTAAASFTWSDLGHAPADPYVL